MNINHQYCSGAVALRQTLWLCYVMVSVVEKIVTFTSPNLFPQVQVLSVFVHSFPFCCLFIVNTYLGSLLPYVRSIGTMGIWL